MEREVRVRSAEAGNEVIFEGPDGAFCVVAAVDTRGNKLEGGGGVMEEVFEGLTALVVHDMELWFAAVADEAIVEEFISFKDGGSFSVGDGSDIDGVAVVVVEEKDVVVACA